MDLCNIKSVKEKGSVQWQLWLSQVHYCMPHMQRTLSHRHNAVSTVQCLMFPHLQLNDQDTRAGQFFKGSLKKKN